MSILIKGMKIPKEGRLTLQISADGAVYVVNSCSITAETYTTDAIPVLPHGKLIEKHDVFKLITAFPEVDKLLPVEFMKALYNLPTIIPEDESNMNTEEIVRCKDCEHWETSWTPRGVSDGRHYCAPLDLYPSADWFCADGKKRTETKQLSNVPVVIEAEEET